MQKYRQGDLHLTGNVRLLETYLSLGASIEEEDRNGNTPLMTTAQCHRTEAVKFLLARKANVNQTNKVGKFALYFAAVKGYDEICEALLESGADQNMKYDGKTAAQWAADRRHFECVEKIVGKEVCQPCFFLCL